MKGCRSLHSSYAEFSWVAQILTVERVQEGVSTWIYRIDRAGQIFYLRVLPESNATFAPEVLVHQLLCAQQLRMPEVIYYEHQNPTLQRSVMVTTAIPGNAIGYGADSCRIYRAVIQAGQELAVINSIKVDGFGWIRRDSPTVIQLAAEFSTYPAWIQRDVHTDLSLLENAQFFTHREIDALAEVISRGVALFAGEPAYLAHGDFDVTHIYHCHGVYTGMIDFGEIRGANSLYDLAHFNIESHELLPYLLQGYGEVTALPDDYMERIRMSSLLIALRRITRRIKKSPGTVYQPDYRLVSRTLDAVDPE